MANPLKHFAVISDIHSNYEALMAVFYDISNRKIPTVVCLGDIIGYGPNPKECVDLIRAHCALTVMGNHDLAMFEKPTKWNPWALKAMKWTTSTLYDKSDPKNAKRVDWLDGLRDTFTKGGITFLHGSPLDPINAYLSRDDVYSSRRSKMDKTIAKVKQICFVGHTHLPSIINAHAQYFEPDKVDHHYRYQGVKLIVNVGSVGQPRDGNNKASYVEYNDDEIFFRRVQYDIDATCKKIKDNPELDDFLGERLWEGR